MEKLKRICSLFLILMTAMTTVAFGTAYALEDSGVVRVLLTRLQLTDQLKLALDGSYSLNNMSFQRGSQLLFSVSGQRIMLYYEGIAVDVGEEAVLIRHEDLTNRENGFRANDSFYLHPGDLHLSIKDGMLRAVLHAPVEEYLYGVVPYEMSNSFPLEALKAQAITARTYALRKKLATENADYDLVDNTNDQAYYGILWDHANGIKAVDETKGLCGIYKKSLAECFYSASNGGQTELVHHVWGNGDYGYITMKDDPYDLENPESVVKSYRISKVPVNNSSLGVLESAILNELTESIETLGYDSNAENIRVLSVDSLKATSPMFADAPSRVMTKLYFSLTVQGRKFKLPVNDFREEDVSMFSTPALVQTSSPAPIVSEVLGDFETIKEPIYVELDLFPLIESLCELDINPGVNNEVITVTELEDAYLLESRRYGHGVGMSQRGAQTMAKDYGWTHEQILRFYYPGMELGTVKYRSAIPTALPIEFLATPGPAASPTPRPTLMPANQSLKDGEYKVIVNQIASSSYLNLRLEPSTSAPVVRQLYYGQELIVTAVHGEWLQVKTDAAQGYVMAQYVENMITAE